MSSIAVVILNWNGREYLERFLPSVIQHTAAGVRIVVADNGSEDDSLNFLRENYPQIEIVELDRNYGFADGYNRALKGVDSQYYILLNSDIEVTPHWIEPLVEMLDNHPEVAAVAPKLLSLNDPDHFEYAGAAGGFIDYLGYPFCRGRILSTIEQDNGQYDTPREVFWASGAALCCRSELFHSLGGFSAEFFAHMEEIDLCWRMQLAGYKIYSQPQSVVYHLGGGTLPNESPRKLYLNYRNNLSMLFRCASTPQRIVAAVMRPMADMLSVVIYLLKGEWSLAGATLRAYRDFFAMHRKLEAERKAIRSQRKQEARQIYRGSIVARYLFRRRFDNLMS